MLRAAGEDRRIWLLELAGEGSWNAVNKLRKIVKHKQGKLSNHEGELDRMYNGQSDLYPSPAKLFALLASSRTAATSGHDSVSKRKSKPKSVMR